MPYDRPLDPPLTVMRWSGMPGRLKEGAQMVENEIIRGSIVLFLPRLVLMMSVVLHETEANSPGLRRIIVIFIT